MDFDHLRTFLEVSRNRSFSKAAEKLGLTQPSISAQIRSLETTIGHRLFDRGGGKVILTAAGRVFEPYAQDSVSRLNQIRQLLDDLERSPRGTLTVSANDSTALYVLPQVFSKFKKQYSRVGLNIVRAERRDTLESVLNRESDFGVVSLPVKDHRLNVELIHKDELVLVASPSHPLANGEELTLAAVAEHNLLLPKQGRRRETLDQLFANQRLVPRVGMEVDSNELLKRLVLAELGMGFLPRFNVLNELHTQQLFVLQVKGVHIPRNLAMISLKDRALTRAGQTFFRFVTGTDLAAATLEE